MKVINEHSSLVKTIIYILLVLGLAIMFLSFLNYLRKNVFSNTTGSVDETTVITFAPGEYRNDLYDPLIKEFQQLHSEITVQIVENRSVDSSQGFTDYARRQASIADVSMINIGYPSFRSGNYFLDLQPLIDADQTFNSGDYWTNSLTGCRDLKGQVMGIPWSLRIYGVFYDEKAFDDAGLPKPAIGWTFNDFRKAVLAFSSENENTYSFVDGLEISASLLGPWVGQNINDSGGEINPFTMQNDLQWYRDMAISNDVYPVRDLNIDNVQFEVEKRQALFRQENSPVMWLGSLSDPIPGENNTSSPDQPFSGLAIDEYGFAPIPVSFTGISNDTTPTDVQCIGISAGSLHPQAAWEWISFLSHQWLVRDTSQAQDLAQIPARRSVAEAVEYYKNIPEKAVPTVQFALEHMWFAGPYVPELNAVAKALTRSISENLNFSATLEDAKKEFVSSLESTPDDGDIIINTPQSGGKSESDKITIRYYPYYINPNEDEALKPLVDKFNQDHPDIQVEVVTLQSPSQAPFSEVINEFDCFAWQTPDWKARNTQGLLNLGPFFESEGPVFTQDFYDHQLDAFRIRGELYGLPANSKPRLMAYNRDLLARRGLTPPGNDWTFDDFITMMVSVSSVKEGDKSYGFLTDAWEPIFFDARGIEAFKSSTNPPVPHFDSSEVINTLAWMVDQRNSGVLLIGTPEDRSYVNQLWSSGHLAFWLVDAGIPTGRFPLPDQGIPFAIGLAPMPDAQETGRSYVYNLERGYFISRTSDNPQACWTWIKFLSGQTNDVFGIPARLSVINSSAWEASVGSEAATIYRQAVTNINPQEIQTNVNPLSSPFYSWRAQAIRSALNGEDPLLVLTRTQQIAVNYLNCVMEADTSTANSMLLNDKINACVKLADPDGVLP